MAYLFPFGNKLHPLSQEDKSPKANKPSPKDFETKNGIYQRKAP